MGTPDVLVIGAGIIGSACARSLSQRGVSVTVLDAGPTPGAATTAAAGMLAPQVESGPDDPLLDLCVRAREMYTELAPALREETGIDPCLATDGILRLAFTEEEAAAAKSTIAWQRQSGFRADWLPPEALRARVPGVSHAAVGARLAPDDGSLNPEALHRALLKSALDGGAITSYGANVTEIVIHDGRVTGVKLGPDTRPAGAVLVAAGCWSGRIGGLPHPLAVGPVRGQMIALEWPRDEPAAIVYGPSGYVLKRGSEALSGSTMENAGFRPTVTVEGVSALMASATQIYPALAGRAPIRSWAGLRPVTSDGRPILGPDPEIRDLWYATGHGRNGILLAGITAEIIARRYVGEPVGLDVTPVDPSRFGGG